MPPKAVVVSPPAPPREIPNLGKTVNTSKPATSHVIAKHPAHRSEAAMLSHMRKTCNGKGC